MRPKSPFLGSEFVLGLLRKAWPQKNVGFPDEIMRLVDIKGMILLPRRSCFSRFLLMQKPDFRAERKLLKRDVWPVAGVDEAGRGPLAGPVAAAACHP